MCVSVWRVSRLENRHPYRGYAIWPPNSLDKTATLFLILDRCVEFWGPKWWIFECMQRNRHFSKKITHVSHKITTFLWNLPLSTIRDLNLEFSNLFKELTNTYRKSMTPIKDSRSDPLILSTKRPLHFWSLIGMSISDAPQIHSFSSNHTYGGFVIL